jgi:Cyclophilin type peptidyl-prolyl cis-trans isomerase/CLD
VVLFTAAQDPAYEAKYMWTAVDAVPQHQCPCPAVVFGRVTEGQGLLQKVNAVGTRSGKPKQRVVIVDCGELPSKRQIMLKLQVRVVCGSCAVLLLFRH